MIFIYSLKHDMTKFLNSTQMLLKIITFVSVYVRTLIVLMYVKVFVGLGFPYEGPAPLEAVANGAAYLNPKVSFCMTSAWL